MIREIQNYVLGEKQRYLGGHLFTTHHRGNGISLDCGQGAGPGKILTALEGVPGFFLHYTSRKWLKRPQKHLGFRGFYITRGEYLSNQVQV